MARARPPVPVMSAYTTCIHSMARCHRIWLLHSRSSTCHRIEIEARACASLVVSPQRHRERTRKASRAQSEADSRIACTSVQWSNALLSVAAIGQHDAASRARCTPRPRDRSDSGSRLPRSQPAPALTRPRDRSDSGSRLPRSQPAPASPRPRDRSDSGSRLPRRPTQPPYRTSERAHCPCSQLVER